jgi:hypothetical protein
MTNPANARDAYLAEQGIVVSINSGDPEFMWLPMDVVPSFEVLQSMFETLGVSPRVTTRAALYSMASVEPPSEAEFVLRKGAVLEPVDAAAAGCEHENAAGGEHTNAAGSERANAADAAGDEDADAAGSEHGGGASVSATEKQMFERLVHLYPDVIPLPTSVESTTRLLCEVIDFCRRNRGKTASDLIPTYPDPDNDVESIRLFVPLLPGLNGVMLNAPPFIPLNDDRLDFEPPVYPSAAMRACTIAQVSKLHSLQRLAIDLQCTLLRELTDHALKAFQYSMDVDDMMEFTGIRKIPRAALARLIELYPTLRDVFIPPHMFEDDAAASTSAAAASTSAAATSTLAAATSRERAASVTSTDDEW